MSKRVPKGKRAEKIQKPKTTSPKPSVQSPKRKPAVQSPGAKKGSHQKVSKDAKGKVVTPPKPTVQPSKSKGVVTPLCAKGVSTPPSKKDSPQPVGRNAKVTSKQDVKIQMSKEIITAHGQFVTSSERMSRESSFSRESVGPAQISPSLVKQSEEDVVTFYADQIFLKKRNKKIYGVSEKKRAVVKIPRYLIEARSPGSRLHYLLSKLDAPQKSRQLRAIRSPGAPPPGFIKCTKKAISAGISQEGEQANKKMTSEKLKKAKEEKKSAEETGMTVEPLAAEFTTQGGYSSHLMTNNSNVRYAVKVKSSDNRFIRVNPVYSFLDSGTINELEVVRFPGGSPKFDRLLVCFVPSKDEDSDPKKAFTLKAQIKSISIKITTRKAPSK